MGNRALFLCVFFLKCIDKSLIMMYIINIRSVAPVNDSLLKGEGMKKWIKKYLREASLLLIAGVIQILVAVIIKLIIG